MSRIKRFFSTSQKPVASPYGDATGNVLVPSMANLNLHNNMQQQQQQQFGGGYQVPPAAGSSRSSTPPPPPIFPGYIGGSGRPESMAFRGDSFFDPNGTGQHPGALGGGGFSPDGVGNGGFNPQGYTNGGVQPPTNPYADIKFLNAPPPPPSVVGTETDGFTSPGGLSAGFDQGNNNFAAHNHNSFYENSNSSNVNNIPPPPPSLKQASPQLQQQQQQGAQGRPDLHVQPVPLPPQPSSTPKPPLSAHSQMSNPSYPTPPPQYSSMAQQQRQAGYPPQHQPSYGNLYQQQLLQQQQQQQQAQYPNEKFGAASTVKLPFIPETSNAPFPPRQQQQPQQSSGKHKLLSSKNKSSGKHAASSNHSSPPPPNNYGNTTNGFAAAAGPTTNVNVTAADIRDTTYMLRQLYKMELAIHGERYAIHEDDQGARREMRRKADLLREEIENNVNTWRTTSGARWTPQEQQHVEYSVQLIGSLRTLGQGE